MGKKIQFIGRYVMDGVTLGKGNFARVELATHGVTQTKVGGLTMNDVIHKSSITLTLFTSCVLCLTLHGVRSVHRALYQKGL